MGNSSDTVLDKVLSPVYGVRMMTNDQLQERRKELEQTPEAKGLTVPVLEEVWNRSNELAKGHSFGMVMFYYAELAKIAQFAVDDLEHKMEAEGRLQPALKDYPRP